MYYYSLDRRAHKNRMVMKGIWLRAWSCISLHYTCRPVTTQNSISIAHGMAFGRVSKGLGHSELWPFYQQCRNLVAVVSLCIPPLKSLMLSSQCSSKCNLFLILQIILSYIKIRKVKVQGEGMQLILQERHWM